MCEGKVGKGYLVKGQGCDEWAPVGNGESVLQCYVNMARVTKYPMPTDFTVINDNDKSIYNQSYLTEL